MGYIYGRIPSRVYVLLDLPQGQDEPLTSSKETTKSHLGCKFAEGCNQYELNSFLLPFGRLGDIG